MTIYLLVLFTILLYSTQYNRFTEEKLSEVTQSFTLPQLLYKDSRQPSVCLGKVKVEDTCARNIWRAIK